jgi:hypothetical protein
MCCVCLCALCSVIAQWLQKVDPKTDGAARDWVAIYDECKARAPTLHNVALRLLLLLTPRSARPHSPTRPTPIHALLRPQNVLYQEIDYMNEGTNAELFRKNFEGTPWVKVPEVYWEKSGQRVLCMEYCPGLKINRVDEIERMGLDRSLLARYGVEAYLQQILRFGAHLARCLWTCVRVCRCRVDVRTRTHVTPRR